jgi:hypothetical protein
VISLVSHHRIPLRYYLYNMAPSSLCLYSAQLLELQERARFQCKHMVPRDNNAVNTTSYKSTESYVSPGAIAAVLAGAIMLSAVMFWFLW